MAHLLILALLLGIIVGTSSQQIRRPPIFTYPITTTYMYNTFGSNVVLNCSADGDPKPTYKWLQNETVVVPSSIITFNTATGHLSINGFTYREAATYICVASNVFDNGLGGTIEVNSWSARLRLLQSRIDRFGGYTAIERSGPQYNYIRLDCNGQNAAVGSTIIYNWYQSNRQDINLDGNRLFIDQMGNLHFTYLLQNDVIPNGYFCGISLENENYIQLGTQYNLQVTASSITGAILPQGQYSNTNVKGLLYTSVKLECVFSGYDPNPPKIPTILWFDDANVQITANSKYNFSMAGRVMTISNVLEQDERQYFCKARNSAGEASMYVYLNVTSGPIFVNGPPSDQTVPENTDTQFTCDTRSAVGEIPPGPPVWRINGVLMGSQTDADKMYLSADGKTLNIRSVKKNTDIMCVQCFVSNDIDSVLANACLNVILPITVVTAPKLVQPIYLGDRVNLTITASTDPSMTLNYKWIIKNVTYEGNNLPTYVVYDQSTMVTYIDTKGMTETQFRNVLGVYRRVVYNTYETKHVDIVVIQEGAPDDYRIAEMGKELHLECSFPSNETSIDWHILRGREAIHISTCSVVDGNCTDLMSTFYNATISSSGGITTAGLNVVSVRINETLLSCVSNNGFQNTTQLDVYARPSKPQCKQQVLPSTIVFTCTTNNSYPGFVPLLHAREMNFNDNPTSILYSSNNTLEVRSAVLTWEIQFRYTKPSMIIYIELIPTLSNLSLIRDAAVFSDDVVTPLSVPEVVLNPTLCPFGPGVSDKKIKKGTTASCKCDLKSAGVPPGSVQWYSHDGSIVDESKNKEDGSSKLTFTYHSKDQSYECRSVSKIQGTRSTMAFKPIFISAAQPTVITGLQPMVIILGVIIYGVVSHLG